MSANRAVRCFSRHGSVLYLVHQKVHVIMTAEKLQFLSYQQPTPRKRKVWVKPVQAEAG